MSEILLYDFDLDENCYKVRLMLSMLGLGYRKIAVNMFPAREHLQPSLLELNPRGSLPILTDGEVALCEAESILAYLVRAYDGGGAMAAGGAEAFRPGRELAAVCQP